MTTNKDEVGMYLFYLATAVLKELPEGTGDTFGIGEDDFIMYLYDYAELAVQLTDKAYDEGKEFNGVFAYESMTELAECFVGIVERQEAKATKSEMPDIDEWELDVKRIIENQ